MIRPASNCLTRASSLRSISRSTSGATRRFLSTSSPVKSSRSWKNSALRWTLAGGAVYYYNTSPVFAEEPDHIHQPPPETSHDPETSLSLDEIRRRKKQIREGPSPSLATRPTEEVPVSAEPLGENAGAATSPEELEEEAGQQGAYDPETGEINWDCPCLGGMAHGPCGEEFKAAFSCFVHSEEEPKGVDCIDKFKGMQDCFRKHPDVYGAELDDDDEDEDVRPVSERASPTPEGLSDTSSAPPSPPQGESDEPGMIVHSKTIPKTSSSAPSSPPDNKADETGMTVHSKTIPKNSIQAQEPPPKTQKSS